MERLVVKIGSSVLTLKNGEPDHARFSALAEDISAVVEGGRSVVIVSSGAIAFGRAVAGERLAPVGIPNKQALSSIGQPLLINAYMMEFRRHRKVVGQVLLTHDDFIDRQRYLNARRSMEIMLEKGFVPIVNENDAIAIDEIKVGDNDTLSAMVAAMINAQRLIILSNIDAIYDRDPNRYTDARPISEIEHIEHYRAFDRGKSRYGVGGIRTKIDAARQLARIGISTTIANGRTDGVVAKLVSGQASGTTVLAGHRKVNGAKKWVSLLLKSSGSIAIDDGALSAVLKDKSLLAAGVVKVTGAFGAGDVVSVTDTRGHEVGRGIANYSAADIGMIRGRKSSQINGLLGYFKGDEIIHRDNLILTMDGGA
ncbi:MAG: glutamate 5-kinase [Deltaproteobacteria bacterium]|nr:glutamate 5-kinase [Deltaproteobacteria bacterium]MCL5277511.1 glutamate 5-kinase [Deltaproteobacteria bacterium]